MTSLSTTYSPGPIDIASGSVTLILTSNNAIAPCSQESAMTMLTINALPSAPIMSSPVCVNGAGSFNLNSITTVTNWYSDASLTTVLTGVNLIISPTVSTTYYGVFNDGNCTGPAATLMVNPLPIVTMSALPNTCINGGVISLIGGMPTGGMYSGTGIQNGVDFNPVTAGLGMHTITYTYIDPASGCSNSASATISVSSVPTPSIIVSETSGNNNNDAEICAGDNVTLLAIGGGTYLWSDNSTTSSISVNPTTTSSYTVTVTDPTTGCTATETQVIIVYPNPTILITETDASGTANDGEICVGDDASLTASGGVSYLWNDPSSSVNNAITVSPITTTTYMVTVTNANGCTAILSSTVIVNPLPDVTITAAGPFCLNSPLANLTAATTGGTWSGTGITDATLGTFDPATAGVGTHTISYSATDATTGCSNTSTTQIIVNALPISSIIVTETSGTTNNDGTICIGDATTLTASGGGTYLWSDPTASTNNAITVSPTMTTTYTVTVTDATTGCTAIATETIIVNPLPTASITETDASGTANDGEICVGDDATLTASGGVSYLWDDAASSVTNAITVSPTTTTTYMVTVTNANGCTAIAASIVIVNPLPDVTITAAGPFCLNSPSANLTAAATGGTWSGTGITDATLGTFDPATAGVGTHTISYSATDATTGCSNFATTQIIVNALPILSITVTETSGTMNNDGIICIGDATTLTASGGGTYLWSNPTASTNNAITVSPTTTTTYTVTVTDATTGCTATSTETIIVNPLPTASITETDASGTANDGEICAGDNPILTASGGVSYLWNDPANSAMSAITISPATTTTYMVTVTNANGCTAIAASTVIVNPLPVITVPMIPAVCADASVFVLPEGTVGGMMVNGDWSGTGVVNNADFNPMIAGTGTHTLTYTFTDGNNCSSSTMTSIIVNALPIISNVITGCDVGMTLPLGTIQVVATGGTNLMYSLDGGTAQTSNTFDDVSNGNHTVTVQDANGCNTTSTLFTINCSTSCVTPPIVSTNPAGPICADVIAVAISGSIGGGATMATWTTSGNGTFGNTTALSTTYMPGTDDISAGTVTLTLTTDATVPCTPETSTIILTINAIPAAPSIVNSVCVNANGSFDLSSISGVTNWYSDASLTTELTGTNLMVSPMASTTYYGIFNNGNCSSSASLLVVNALPTVTMSALADVCISNTTFVLTAGTPSGGTYSGAGVEGGMNFNPSLAGIGTHTITYTYTDVTTGCTNSTTETITVNPLPTPNITVTEVSGTMNNDAEICAGDNVTLSASGGGTYVWSNLTASNNNAITVAPTATTTFTVTVTNANGCTATTTQTIIVYPNPTATITVTDVSGNVNNDGQICGGDMATLAASGGGSYLWSDAAGSTTASINVMPTATTIYTVTVTNANGCSDAIATTVIVSPNPDATISSAGPFCLNSPSANLTAATSGGTWSGTGITNASLGTFDPATAGVGTHTVSYNITNATTGCSSSDDIQIVVNDIPTASIIVTETSGTTNNDAMICAGDAATLTANSGGTYAWSNSTSTSAITVMPTTTTTYTVTITNSAGCTATATQIINVNPVPVVSITETDASGSANDDNQICNGDIAMLTASGGGSYQWNDPASSTTASITISPTTTTTYTVTVTNANSCTATASSTITVDPLPIVTFAPMADVCENTPTFPITGVSPIGGIFSGPGVQSGMDFNSMTAGVGTHTIDYIYTDPATGCENSIATTVTVYALPVISSATPSCAAGLGSGVITVSATISTGGLSYSIDGTNYQSSNVFTNLGNGIYTVYVKDSNSPNNCETIEANVIIDCMDPIVPPTITNVGGPTFFDPCFCLNNATTTDNGQFGEEVIITSNPGLTWTITSVSGLYTTASPAPPALPIPVTVGTIIQENPAVPGQYFMTAKHVDGIGYTITAESAFYPGVQLTISNTCFYPEPLILDIEEQIAVCGSTFDISAIEINGITPDNATLVISGPNGYSQTIATNPYEVTLDPSTLIEGIYNVTFTFNAGPATAASIAGLPAAIADPGCVVTVMDQFEIVPPFFDPIVCNNNIQVSLDENCQAVITADMILEGTYANNLFEVEITDQNGNIIPGNILNASHVGQTLMVSVIGNCGGNSCWGSIVVEDKLPPVIVCADVTISCDDALPNEPTATDACGTVTVAMLSEVVVENDCGVSIFSEIITRVWEATDGSGNTANCTQVISRERAVLADIIFPDTITIDCAHHEDDVYQNTDATNTHTYTTNLVLVGKLVTGEPTGTGCDNIIITSEDIIVSICDGSYKVLRTWTATDWCAIAPNNIITATQIIKVLDSTPPVVTNPTTIVVGTTSTSCTGNVLLPSITATDDCSGIGATTYFLNGTVILNGVLTNAALGTHTIDYEVADGCGNIATGSFEVEVIDDYAPLAICDEFTVIGIGSDGIAIVDASVFDDGSYDNCGIVTMEVRRMTDACHAPQQLGWKPAAEFCCADIGTTVMVEFRVTDAAGNSNSCMVEVTVEDKLAPSIICPPSKTISCSDDYTDLALTGEAITFDNCSTVTPTFVDNVNISCGGIGTVTRIWSVTDDSNNSSSCVQFITIENPTPFDVTNITWAPDYTTSNCGTSLEPSDLPTPYNGPVIDAASCADIAVVHEDLILPIQGDACYKIIRTWTVIDWCQYEPNNPSTGGIWLSSQVLKVTNSQAPSLNCTGDSFVQNFEANCGSTYVNLNAQGNDDCTPTSDLTYSWTTSNGLSGTGNDASQVFTNGNYSITWTVADGCGNEQTCTFDFTVVDAKKPTPVCINGLSTVLMPSSGMVMVNPMMFETGSSFDNCTAYGDLQFSFSSDVTDVTKIFTCADIVTGDTAIVEIWVTDEAGNQDYCTTYILLQDPNGACPPTTAAALSGFIETEDQEQVENVTIDLVGSGMVPFMTGAAGTYNFPNMAGGNYIVTPEKDVNPLNGVTTFDLVLINRHILGVQVLDSPYKMIASDANNSNTITTFDMVVLRRLILQIDTEFQNNTSWRFVDMDYVFPDPTNPWLEVFPEVIDAAAMSANTSANFVGVKIGDVNGSAAPNQLVGTDTRTFDGALVFSLENRKVQKGEEFKVDFRTSDFNNTLGYQFTLGFDQTKIEFIDVKTNLTKLDEGNFGFTMLEDGFITTSWNSHQAVEVEEDAVLFSMTFIATASEMTSNLFNINSRYTMAEAYNGSDLYDVVLAFDKEVATERFELFQNMPNPFKEETIIGFNLPEAGAVTLKIYDVSGRVYKLITIDANQGYNSVTIDRTEIGVNGVLYYQLNSATETGIKKMILVD